MAYKATITGTNNGILVTYGNATETRTVRGQSYEVVDEGDGFTGIYVDGVFIGAVRDAGKNLAIRA